MAREALLFLSQNFTLLWLVSAVLFILSGIFYEKLRLLFWVNFAYTLILCAIFFLGSAYMVTMTTGGTMHTYGKANSVVQVARAAAAVAAFYGGIGIITALVRKLVGKPGRRLLKYSLIAFVVGMAIVVAFRYLPCQYSQNGCTIEPPYHPTTVQ
jgi:hypothetical protein